MLFQNSDAFDEAELGREEALDGRGRSWRTLQGEAEAEPVAMGVRQCP